MEKIKQTLAAGKTQLSITRNQDIYRLVSVSGERTALAVRNPNWEHKNIVMELTDEEIQSLVSLLH